MYKNCFLFILSFVFLFPELSFSQQTISIKKKPSISGYYYGKANGKQIHLLFNEQNEVAFIITDQNKVVNPKGKLAACLTDSICEEVERSTYTIDSTSIVFEILQKTNNKMYLTRFEGEISRNNRVIELRKTETDKLREIYTLKRKK